VRSDLEEVGVVLQGCASLRQNADYSPRKTQRDLGNSMRRIGQKCGPGGTVVGFCDDFMLQERPGRKCVVASIVSFRPSALTPP
jgi:hypothetical protein